MSQKRQFEKIVTLVPHYPTNNARAEGRLDHARRFLYVAQRGLLLTVGFSSSADGRSVIETAKTSEAQISDLSVRYNEMLSKRRSEALRREMSLIGL